jgi:hypothetical protein
MAFTRKAVSAIEGITPAQVDAIMTLHGTSMGDYIPKSELDAEVEKKLKEKLGDLDIDTLKKEAAKVPDLEKAAAKGNDRLIKAAMKELDGYDVVLLDALLTDRSSIKIKDDDTVEGLKEAAEAIAAKYPQVKVSTKPRVVSSTPGAAKEADDTKSKANEALRGLFGKGEGE